MGALANFHIIAPLTDWIAMRITEVRVHKVEFPGHTRAFASVTFDGEFVVHDLRVVEGDGGRFVVMPHRRLPTGERRDVAHPLTNEFRAELQAAVLAEYERCPVSSVK